MYGSLSYLETMLSTRRQLLAALAGTICLPLDLSGAHDAKAGAHKRGLDQYLPFQLLRPDEMASVTRKVFAHWHFFPISIDNKRSDADYYALNYLKPEGENGKYFDTGGYIRERPLARVPRTEADWLVRDMIDDMSAAVAIGVDAFQVNLRSVSDQSIFWKYFTAMLSGIRRMSPPFKIFPCLDCTSTLFDGPVELLADSLAAVVSDPGLMRTPDGRLYLSAFAAERVSTKTWETLVAALSDRGWRPYFFPMFLEPSKVDHSILSLTDIVSIWGGDDLTRNELPKKAVVSENFGGAWCQPVWPQDFRPKVGWCTEASNSLLFRSGWEQAIAIDSHAVNILTWNDYSEGSEIRPSSSIQYSYYDLAAYYVAKFKLQSEPEIVRDVLYFFYRVEAPSGEHLGALQNRSIVFRPGSQPTNDIELLAFLKAPGRLTVKTETRVVHRDVGAGVSSVRVPLDFGHPRFELHRNGAMIVSVDGNFEIRKYSTYQDLLYHGGSSSRIEQRY